MDESRLILDLNDAQRLAVSAPQQALLVLAGAGSGKTKVLVHRIAWHIQINHIAPQNILAVTFTNKAAQEMRHRLEALLAISARSLWIGTFHSLAHRLLRQHYLQAKLPATFQVMDSDDQLQLLKRLLKSLEIDDNRWPPKQVQWYINGQKEQGIRARHIADSGDFFQRQMLTIYKAYEQLCERSGLVDFSELLLRAHELLRDTPELLSFYRQRFRQVLVDEFQDTNTIQYAWLRLLTEGNNNLFIVGDDDQSIYGWRGAKIENLFLFQKHYPEHQIIRLEQNYRSTTTILKAANAVIANNDNRLGKELWTETGDGVPISLYSAFNEQDEAHFVVEKIRLWIKEGGLRNDIAILYRSNAQSRQFEERLMTTAIPYRVYGGLRFFERQEIKNALAYLRLTANRHDDASFERVVNTPTRGIGLKTLEDMRQLARVKQISLWQSAELLLAENQLSARASNALQKFVALINQLSADNIDKALDEMVKQVVEASGLIDHYQKSNQDKSEARVENLQELVNAAKLFDLEANESDAELSDLDLFLTHAALEAGGANTDAETDHVQLMTLHSAKGLEFKLVFLVGMEDGLFPSQQSLDDLQRLQEERRLCYVGITRAREQLVLSHAESRRIYGQDSYPIPSRFLREIPPELMQEVRLRAHISRPLATTTPTKASFGTSYRTGENVRHDKFGEGVVLQSEGQGEQEKVQINFRHAGIKWLMVAYAKLARG